MRIPLFSFVLAALGLCCRRVSSLFSHCGEWDAGALLPPGLFSLLSLWWVRRWGFAAAGSLLSSRWELLSSCSEWRLLFIALHRLLIALHRLLMLWRPLVMWGMGCRRRGFSSCSAWAPLCTGLVALRHVGSSWTRDRTRVSYIGRRTTEPPGKPMDSIFLLPRVWIWDLPDQGIKIPQAKQCGPKKEEKRYIKWKDIFLWQTKY